MRNELGLDPGTEMSVEEYERRLDEHRKAKAQEKRQRAEEEARAKKAYEDALPHKMQLPFDEALAQEICERISAGELLISICEELHMPTIRRANQWRKDYPEFEEVFKESVQDRLSIFEEQVLQIADDMSRDFKEVIRGGKSIRVVDAEVIARAKLRVDVRFKHLKAGKPQKWGDTQTLITKSDGEDPADLSSEELEKRLRDLDVKDRIFKVV